ncbi:portal vertex protein [uncultured Caudovirales phage]|uniref:Portal vertex protein n=1 Tax=uncultured Caudovirales phage TaxID=2100421 RepID=A0A6J5NYY4_9CAUD|nr:portal vertex protein [uncultured Caudovirales phage]
MASLRKRLQNLFATNVIVRAYGKDQLKVVDTNRLQSTGNLNQTKVADRYTRLHGSNRHRVGGMGGYDSNYYMHQNRMQLYTDYEMMDKDPIISAALDIYADESTLADQFGDILTIKTNKTHIQKILYNLFYDVLNIEFNLWPWIRNMTKYGDFFLKLDIANELGVINARPFSSYEVERWEEFAEDTGDYKIKFRHASSPGLMYDVFEVAHFRMLSDSNFLPYGKSMLEGARKEFQKLTMLEDAMLIHRIMRAPEKRIFKIDIGNIPPNEVDTFMEQVINKMKKIPHVDAQTGNYNLKFNLNNMLEDYYLPVRGGQSSTAIDTLPGMTFTGIDDINYVKDKMMAALKIPKPFLGYAEAVEGKTTLASMDIRFARTIERIQKIVTSELYKIAIVHLYAQGYEGEDLVGFELELTAPSIVYDQQKVALMTEKMTLATSMKDSKLVSDKYIYEYIFNMSEEQWLSERVNVIEDLKLRFRQNQLEQEGNDPAVTGVSYGTPHDLASMHMSSDDVEDKDKGGRPKEGIKFGQHKNAFGWDPTGKKEIDQAFDSENQKSAFLPDPRRERKLDLAHENVIKTMKRSKNKTESNIILESMAPGEKPNSDAGTLLDENNIL